MSCNTNRDQCDPRSIYAGVAMPGCAQFFNPSNLQGEQLIYDNYYNDLINSFGVPVNYYVHTFNLSAADLLYGQHSTAPFAGPFPIQMYIELVENAINLSKFGYASDDTLTAYVHIETFTTAFSAYVNYANINQRVEPKSGDLIELTVLGCDRPNGRGPKIFEITERVDQDVATLNPLMGHYVYRLRAKRYEHSFEPTLTGESANNQVYDNARSGIVNSTITNQLSSPPKSYTGDIDNTSKNNVLDMSINDTDIYGTYY